MSKMNKDKGPHKAKNKISDIKENDIEVVVENSADERNTVIVDKDFENLEFDDKVWLWWKENKISAIVSVLAALAIIVIVNGYKMLEQKAIKDAQTAYSQCSNNAELEAFATEYAYSELAGLAALQIADEEYKNSNFAKAQEFYAKAKRSLSKKELSAKALIGEAFCQIKQGKNQEAIESLKIVAQSESVSPAYKAQASFEWAVLEYANASKEVSKSILDKLVANPQAGLWATKAKNFLKANF